ncbi:hypothetical protein EMCRGX_G011532 [Ephydatia muelleri]
MQAERYYQRVKCFAGPCIDPTENVQASSSRTSFSRNEMMLDSADASDQDLLVVERKTFKSLCSGLVQQCGCLSNPSWTIASFIKYMNFALFAGMGVVKQKYISSGLNIPEVAHDYQATIKQCVQQLGMVNSYDTWHGTKNVAKQLRHICAGTVRTRDRTWFTELSDKGMYFLDILIKNGISGYLACTKVHLYWCMRNCGGNPDRLRAMIMNISKHFQGDHQSCSSESPCQQPGYVPQRKPLTMPAAISAYEASIRKTLIYKNA